MHDESAYNNLFGEDYPRKDDNIKLEETLGGEAEDTFAMVYFAERLPIVTKSEDEAFNVIFELF
jgi:hypothetical protein